MKELSGKANHCWINSLTRSFSTFDKPAFSRRLSVFDGALFPLDILSSDSTTVDSGEVSPVVKESGIVDLSKDPPKYFGLKGEILGLSNLTIANGTWSTISFLFIYCSFELIFNIRFKDSLLVRWLLACFEPTSSSILV